ncbi:squalene/phytoene synthase family protein [Aggregatilineales bacterium SYSU G02658]
MSLIRTPPWEVRLLSVAHEAFNSPPACHMQCDAGALESAYDLCEQITLQHSKTFYVASSLLPPAKRRAVRALYAFCRVTDDIVDQAPDGTSRDAALRAWQETVFADHPDHDEPVALAWADTRARFHIPRGYALQLIEGCARDIRQTRYETFDELAEYSYGVASTVGLMAMHIVGFAGAEAIPYAVRLGIALQITNILRDVGEDWRNGRLYLPLEEMREFNLSEADVARGVVTPAWREFMRFQIARNRRLYAESIAGVALLNTNGRFAITAAARLYEAILKDIEAHDYDVFSRRARISTLGKLRRLPGIWWFSARAKVHTGRGGVG